MTSLITAADFCCKNTLNYKNVTNGSKATMFTSANLTGTPTAPTASSGTSSTRYYNVICNLLFIHQRQDYMF